MPDRYAVASADASLPSTWDGGVSVPVAGDTVRPNGFVVQVTGTLTATTLLNAAGGGAVAGGSFNLLNGGVIQANLTWGNGTPLVTYAGSTAASIVGQVGSASGTVATNGIVVHSGAGDLSIVGPIAGGSINSRAVWLSSTGNVAIVGDVANAGSYGAIYLASSGTVSVIGRVSASANAASSSISSPSNGSGVSIIGDVLASSGSAIVVSRDVSVNGDIYASAVAAAISATKLTLVGNMFSAGQRMAAYVPQLVISPTTAMSWQIGTTSGGTRTLYTANHPDSGADMPAAAHVRSGISYANASMTGTCAVPAAAYVSLGVPVDATVGTLLETDTTALTEAVAALEGLMSTPNADALALTETTATLEALLAVLEPVLPDVPAVVIPAPTGPTSTVAYCYCRDAHGAPAEGTEIHIRALRGGGTGRAYTHAPATATADATGLATVEIPRDPTLRFTASRGRGGGAQVEFAGVNADTLELPAVLGRP